MGHEDHDGRVEQLTAADPHLRNGSVRNGGTAGEPLHEVTPGLDPFERVRSATLRAVMLTRAISRDFAAVIDKGVAAASEEARAAWQRWSPPPKAETPPPKSETPPSEKSASAAEPPPGEGG